ncbi:MAG: cytidylate kinase-like family protein [Clostridiales bacterium]|nr:cytidylate kinase-like family protein [Clostridiales bacterium]
MDHIVITIARGYGSGGRKIGHDVARALCVEYLDRKLLRLASDASGIHEQYFGQADENPSLKMLLSISKRVQNDNILPPDSNDFISNENLFNYQAQVIRELAKQKSCVIIGRCADYVLRDYPNVVRIRIHAPHALCVRELMQRNDISERASDALVQLTDKRRASYYRYFTGQSWQDAGNYDLCLNSHKLGHENCVELIQKYVRLKTR